jgi:hypothetical protein
MLGMYILASLVYQVDSTIRRRLMRSEGKIPLPTMGNVDTEGIGRWLQAEKERKERSVN